MQNYQKLRNNYKKYKGRYEGDQYEGYDEEEYDEEEYDEGGYDEEYEDDEQNEEEHQDEYGNDHIMDPKLYGTINIYDGYSSIDVQDVNMNDNTGLSIIEEIKKYNTIHTANCNLCCGEYGNMLFSELLKLPQINNIKLDEMIVYERFLDVIFEALEGNDTLEFLSITFDVDNIYDKSRELTKGILMALRNNNHLKKLEIKIAHNIWDDQIMECLYHLFKNNDTLEELYFEKDMLVDHNLINIDNNYGNDLDILIEGLKYNKTLKNICLGGLMLGEIGSRQIKKLMLTNNSLVSISLKSTHFINYSSKIILETLYKNNSIKKIDFSNTNLCNPDLYNANFFVKYDTMEYLSGMILNNKSLKFLILDNIELTYENTKILFEALMGNFTLESLSLNKIFIDYHYSEKTKKCWDKIYEYLSSNECYLKSLYLNDNDISINIEGLCHALIKNIGITTLGLRNIFAYENNIRYISDMLYSNNSIKSIDLSLNPIGKGLKNIADMLSTNQTLEYINLERVSCDSNDISYFFEKISNNNTLKELYFGNTFQKPQNFDVFLSRDNVFDDQCANSMKLFLEKNNSLEKISIYANDSITENGLNDILNSLSYNTNVTHFYFGGSFTNTEQIEKKYNGLKDLNDVIMRNKEYNYVKRFKRIKPMYVK